MENEGENFGEIVFPSNGDHVLFCKYAKRNAKRLSYIYLICTHAHTNFGFPFMAHATFEILTSKTKMFISFIGHPIITIFYFIHSVLIHFDLIINVIHILYFSYSSSVKSLAEF